MGFFKKQIDPNLLVENMANQICEAFSIIKEPDIEKFMSNSYFQLRGSLAEDFISKFWREKLRFLVGIALISTYKATGTVDHSEKIIKKTIEKIGKFNQPELKNINVALGEEARDYATIRTSHPAKDAGKLVESKFSKEIFGKVPSEDEDTDARYLLYKQLSKFERKAIFSLNRAIHDSKI